MSRRGPIIAGVLSVAVALAAFFLLVYPKFKEVGAAQEDLQAAQEHEVVLETELARLQEAKKNAPQLMKQLAAVRRSIPPATDLPGLINLLQDAADLSEVDFFSISPSTPVLSSSGGASKVPASIQVVGGFFQVDEFLFRLENLQREAKVTSMQVGEGPDQAPQISVLLSVSFFTTDITAGPGAPVQTAPAAAPAATPAPSQEGA